MCLWTKQALYCQSDNSKKFVLLLIEKGEMNLVLPVVRHFVRLHGNPKMLLVSKKVLVLPISFECHWIELWAILQKQKGGAMMKNTTRMKLIIMWNGMQDCGIQGDQHSLKLFAGECGSYQLMSAGGVWIRRYREWDREREMDERLWYNITLWKGEISLSLSLSQCHPNANSSVACCCYQRFSAGKVLDVSICFLSVFYIILEPFISGFSIWHQGIYLQF